MINSPSSKKHCPDQPEISEPPPKSQHTKMGKPEDSENKVTLKTSIQIRTITHFSNHQNNITQEAKTLFFFFVISKQFL